MRATDLVCAAICVALSVEAGAQNSGLTTFRSQRYQISTDLERIQALEIARHMDAVAGEYARRLSGFAVRNSQPTPLYVFSTQEKYLEFLEAKGIDASNTAGIFWRGSEAGLAAWVRGQSREAMLGTLQHEGFHQFSHLRLGDTMPRWAGEGLAEYFEAGLIVGRRLQVGLASASRLESLQQNIAQGEALPFEELINMDASEWSERVRTGDPSTRMMYEQSWSIVHFLVHANRGRYTGAFEDYLGYISRGWHSERAFSEAFGTDNLTPFEQAWERYIETLEPDPLSTAVERLTFLGEGLRELHGLGIEVASLEDLQRELQGLEFFTMSFSHGIPKHTSSDDQSLFAPPDSGNPRRAAALAMKPGEGGAPPEIEVTGLEARVKLEWSEDEEGELAPRVTLR